MKKQKGGIKILVGILVVLVIVAGALLAMKIIKDRQSEQTSQGNANIDLGQEEVKQPKEVQIYKGTDRPIAVMIDNHEGALPQAGLNDAYVVYEMIVEGGYTRLMPIFKGVDLEKIGPIRSARHNFLDYALENDAIYVHYGWSPYAESDISKLGVNNIHGLVQSTSYFWRVKDKSSPHDVVTTTEKILELAKKYEYKTTSTQTSVLHYVGDEFDLQAKEGANQEQTQTNNATNQIEVTAPKEDGVNIPYTVNTVTIPYNSWNVVKYQYNPETKMYTRYSRKEKQTDWDSGDDITTKNIIITFAKNVSLDNVGRQDIKNIGTLDGYYITNGKAIKITCEKESRKSKTIYKDMDGNEINVNDGRTWINICPIDSEVTFE